MNTQIIILAAGHGKRMKSDIPKALTILKGKPFIKHVLDSVCESGVCEKPIIVISEKGDSINKYLGDEYIYAIQKDKLGTGHAVMMAEKLVEGKEIVLVLYADTPFISSNTIRNLVEIHSTTKATMTMATAVVPDFEDWRGGFSSFGRFVRNKNGDIEKIVETKDANDLEKMIREVNPAYMCFDAKWMWEHLKELKNENVQGEYYLTDLVAMAFKESRKISSIEIDPKEALGVNTKEQLETLESLM